MSLVCVPRWPVSILNSAELLRHISKHQEKTLFPAPPQNQETDPQVSVHRIQKTRALSPSFFFFFFLFASFRPIYPGFTASRSLVWGPHLEPADWEYPCAHKTCFLLFLPTGLPKAHEPLIPSTHKFRSLHHHRRAPGSCPLLPPPTFPSLTASFPEHE